MHHFLDERPICCRWCSFLSERLQQKMDGSWVDTCWHKIPPKVDCDLWPCDARLDIGGAVISAIFADELVVTYLLGAFHPAFRTEVADKISLAKPVRQRTYRQLQRCHLAACCSRLLPRAAEWHRCSCVPTVPQCKIMQDRLSKVQQLQATERAFAATLADGLVTTWGDRCRQTPRCCGLIFSWQRTSRQLQRCHSAACCSMLLPRAAEWHRWNCVPTVPQCKIMQDRLSKVQQLQAARISAGDCPAVKSWSLQTSATNRYQTGYLHVNGFSAADQKVLADVAFRTLVSFQNL